MFRQLKSFQDGHREAVAVEYVDAILGEPPTPASKHFVVQRDVAPAWELVEARIRSDAVYAPSFYILLAIAGPIGAVGILTNSQILIVGAMVVGPEYTAIMGVALGTDKRARRPVLRGFLALLAGFAAAMVVTLLFGLAIRWSGHTPGLYETGVRPVSDLINNPNLFSVVVAVLAGIVGVVSLTEARASALIGVFISVTTIPAAADVGLSLAYSSWGEARGSGFPAAAQRGVADRGGRRSPPPPAHHLARARTAGPAAGWSRARVARRIRAGGCHPGQAWLR